METITEQAANLRKAWETDRRWAGIRRDYTAEDVIRLRRPVVEEHPLARRGARRLWELLQSEDAVRVLGAISSDQAAQPVKAGLQAVYLSGGPLAAPQLVRRINNAAPDAFELMKSVIEAGAAAVHFEDLLPSERTGGHLGGRVLVPTGQYIRTLTAARLAADVLDVPALVIAQTHAHSAPLLSSDADERDHEFLTGERTANGFYRVEPGLYAGVTRGLAFAPYADLSWLETSTPSLAEARAFATVIHSQYPDQLLAYSCSASFNGRAHQDGARTAKFQQELAAMGYRFQFVTSSAFPAPQPATWHELETSTGYFDPDTQAVAPGAGKMALAGSAEGAQLALS